ncbi:ribosomal protein S2, flavodoxin-like domain-containing protein [Umbelopsis sp. AD052]|nr:ribosomal protein S2, flavodoxin-like domain-containing protein [Umbelopsis sp. AD052]
MSLALLRTACRRTVTPVVGNSLVWRSITTQPARNLASKDEPLESLIPSKEDLKTVKLVRPAPQAVNSYNLTISKLLAAGLHLGHSTSLWNPATLPFIFGTRAGISIINLEHTLVYLRRACNVVREVAQRGGTVLFVGTRPEISELTIDAARNAEGYHVSGKWTPGTLTNAHQVLGRHATPDPQDPGRPPKTYKPDIMILFNPLENDIAIAEAQLNNIPTIAITDSDYDPRRVTYPIPANDDSIRGVELVAKVLAASAREGVIKRKQLMDRKEKSMKASRDFRNQYEGGRSSN